MIWNVCSFILMFKMWIDTERGLNMSCWGDMETILENWSELYEVVEGDKVKEDKISHTQMDAQSDKRK